MAVVYELEKKLWTEADFDVMGWHDCPIHAMAFNNGYHIVFDIDYIFEWVLSKNKRNYKFWISPCTLVFKSVHHISFETDYATIEINNISRQNPQQLKSASLDKLVEYDWIIETTTGEISFKSIGFEQYVRQAPVLIPTQGLDLEIRKGISFDQTVFI